MSIVDRKSDLLMHDGSLLSGVTSAIQLGGKVLMGSANSPGPTALPCADRRVNKLKATMHASEIYERHEA